jgi:hypothetical protein
MILGYLSINDFLRSRLVCKRFNLASKTTWNQWTYLITNRGPLQITEDSVHRTNLGYGYAPCYISSKTNKCNIVTHYHRSDLFPVFDCNDNFNKYIEATKVIGTKYVGKLKRQLVSVRKKKTALNTMIYRLSANMYLQNSYNKDNSFNWNKCEKTRQKIYKKKRSVEQLEQQENDLWRKVEAHTTSLKKFKKDNNKKL